MIAKSFKIICNSPEYLTNEAIAKALLDQITLKAEDEKVFFAVAECKNSVASIEAECSLAAELE